MRFWSEWKIWQLAKADKKRSPVRATFLTINMLELFSDPHFVERAVDEVKSYCKEKDADIRCYGIKVWRYCYFHCQKTE